MKVRNIMFTGFMAAILGATSANAAISVASQGYVDAKVGAVSTSVSNLETTVSNTYQTKAEAETAASGVETELAKKVDQTVYDAHLTAQEAIDAKQTEDISKNTAAIATLNGDAATPGSVKNEIKVLSDLLGGTAGDVSGLTTQVSANTTAIEKLNAEAATIGSVANSIAEALKDYSTTEQVDAKDTATLDAAKEYADGLADNYDAAGSAAAVEAKLADYTKTSDLDSTFATDSELNAVDAKFANYTTTEALTTTLNNYATNTALKAEEDARKAADEATTNALKDYTKTSELDAGFVSEEEMTTFKSSNDEAIADAKKAGTDAATVAAAAQSKADENAESISQLETDLATKITAPDACATQDCVLSINKASGTIAWVPLTEPVEDYLTE